MPATYDPRPIGVFDSGLGGLTSVREILRGMPGESVVYFGDTARLPYGNKSAETVTRFSLEISSFLVRQNVKCLVVACNTASSHALGALESSLEIPVVGVIEPAVRAAIAASPHGRIGLIGTLGTVASGAYPAAIEEIAPGTQVLSRACPLFVPLIEEGWLDHPVTRAVAEEYLVELRGAQLESLILGCTHYPLIGPLLRELMPGVTLIDSGAEAARAVAALLDGRGQRSAGPTQHHFYLSDEPRGFQRIAQGFLGRDLPAELVMRDAVVVVDQTDLRWFERAPGRGAMEKR